MVKKGSALKNADWDSYQKNKRHFHPPGTAPGTLIDRTDKSKDITITLTLYSADKYLEKKVSTIEECWASENSGLIIWINIKGLPTPQILEKLGQHFGLHPLSLEDVNNIGQRPKFDDYGDYDFVIMDSVVNGFKFDQVNIFFSHAFVITIAQDEGDSFSLIRDKLKRDSDLIKKQGTDYLVYRICDALVDQFFPVLEKFEQELDELEDSLLNGSGKNTINKIHHLKRKLLFYGRIAWAEREVINSLLREESDLIQRDTANYLRDCYDHTIQIIDMIEVYRDIATGSLDVYLSSISNQMNAVMKTLTIIATIFIPLTFIVGVYGMNFNPAAGKFSMPELNWEFGYVAVWVFMIIVSVGMLLFFRRRKWL